MSETACSTDDIAVLQLVARGWTARRIAEHLSRTPRQVYYQLGNIREQLGARTNTHAVVIAVRRGLV